MCHWDTMSQAHNNTKVISSMKTSSHGNIFRVTGPLRGESAGHQWIPFTKAGDAFFSLIYAWTNGWANNWDADGLRHHRAHYDITVIFLWSIHNATDMISVWYGDNLTMYYSDAETAYNLIKINCPCTFQKLCVQVYTVFIICSLLFKSWKKISCPLTGTYTSKRQSSGQALV